MWKLTMVLVGTLCAATSFAGEPDPVPFDSISISINMAEPYGKSTLIIECAPSKQGRKIQSLKLKTGKGEILASASLTANVRNAVSVQITSLDQIKGDDVGEFFLRIFYLLGKHETRFIDLDFDLAKKEFRVP